MMGSSSFATKFLITCLIVSVDRTVEMPNLLPNKDARVLFPVPDVPARRMRIFLFDSIVNELVINYVWKTYRQDQKQHRNP